VVLGLAGLLAVFLVGLAHPLIIMAIGLVLVGGCGAGLVFWKD
jgi:hypothetical protein